METSKAKSYFWIFLDIFLAGLIIGIFFFVMPMLSSINNSRFPSRTFYVNAEGKTTVKPDLAQFSFSVITEGVDLVKVASDNNQRLAEGIKFVKEEGIPAEDLKTTQYSLNPKYEYHKNQGQSFIVGYTLTQTVQVKIKDLEKNLDKISKILGGLPELGINQVSGVSFTVENPEEFLVIARKEAFEKARSKAESMAKGMGVGLGRVVSFNEFNNGPIYPYYDKAMGMGGEGMVPAPQMVSIEPGTEEITIQVNVTYEIR